MKNIKKITAAAVMSALICVSAPFAIPIPISPVPITLSLMVILLASYILGSKPGTISCAVYILLGLIGLPVFSGFTGGAGKLLGPTGGYIIGYLFTAFIAGITVEKFSPNKVLCFLGMFAGVLVCYLFGTVWLSYQAGMGFIQALWAGVIPYIPADIVKIIIVLLIAPPIKRALERAGVISNSAEV